MQRARQIPASNDRYDAVVFLASALVHIDRGERLAAADDLAKTKDLEAGEYWAATLWVQAVFTRSRARSSIIESQLSEEMERHPETTRSRGADGRYVRAAQARLSAVRGRPCGDAAAHSIKSSTDRVIVAAAANRQRKFHRALQYSAPATHPDQPPRPRAVALVINAAASQSLGRTRTAVDMFGQAHALIEHEGLYTSYDVLPATDLDRLSDLTGLHMPPDLQSLHDKASVFPQLSSRERDVLSLLLTHAALADIANQLFISRNTLKTTLQRLYRKLGVNSRQAAADLAQAAGFE